MHHFTRRDSSAPSPSSAAYPNPGYPAGQHFNYQQPPSPATAASGHYVPPSPQQAYSNHLHARHHHHLPPLELKEPNSPKGKKKKDKHKWPMVPFTKTRSSPVIIALGLSILVNVVMYMRMNPSNNNLACAPCPDGVENIAAHCQVCDCKPTAFLLANPYSYHSIYGPHRWGPTPSSSSSSSSDTVEATDDPLYIPDDLSADVTWDPGAHHFMWEYCITHHEKNRDYLSPDEYICSSSPKNEQGFQLTFYGSHVRKTNDRPKIPECVQIPPHDYRFPSKFPVIPATEDAVHWPNLRVRNRSELVMFNPHTPKNLYHFHAQAYDQEHLADLKVAARYIPFGKKIRLMLDIGAGGGSMGILVKRKYDVQTISTIFADWPYCEYITERGNPCILADSMEALPFAKYSFDVLHASWVYHGQQPETITAVLRELNRVVRPGGYIWLYDGYAKSQVRVIEAAAQRYGWHLLHEYRRVIEATVTNRVSFGENLPYELEWRAIWVKPISGVARTEAGCIPPSIIDDNAHAGPASRPISNNDDDEVATLLREQRKASLEDADARRAAKADHAREAAAAKRAAAFEKKIKKKKATAKPKKDQEGDGDEDAPKKKADDNKKNKDDKKKADDKKKKEEQKKKDDKKKNKKSQEQDDADGDENHEEKKTKKDKKKEEIKKKTATKKKPAATKIPKPSEHDED